MTYTCTKQIINQKWLKNKYLVKNGTLQKRYAIISSEKPDNFIVRLVICFMCFAQFWNRIEKKPLKWYFDFRKY